LPKTCTFCRKNKYENKILEKLVKCINYRAFDSILDAAKNSDNLYVKGLAGEDLIAKEAHYHSSCYKLFIKPQKAPNCDG